MTKQDNKPDTGLSEETDWDNCIKAYYEKPSSFKTWSGYDVKAIYTPDDMPEDHYKKKIQDAGNYPYTRGIHANMFRGRLWTKREIAGIGTPQDTHERLKYLVEAGGSGLNTILDITGALGIDPDHPLAGDEVGLTGVNVSSLTDMEFLTGDIPLDKISWSMIAATTACAATMSQYIAVAENAGYDISTLRGSIQNDPIHTAFCGFKPSSPLDLSIKLGCDVMEFCTKSMPQWYHTTVNMYDMREQGITAPQEVAYGFGIAMCYIDELISRGLNIDDFAPRFTFYVACHIDIFEEIAKIRAARRMWAKLMKEKYGAKNEKSIQFKFAVHTSGCSLVPQQPLNNLIRVAYQALSAVLGGVQSLHCCSYDEPICLPTEASHLQALRTQQILAYETGVTNVADPLGGSYFIESLTDKMEEEITKATKEVDDLGGMYQAIKTGWMEQRIEEESFNRQKEIENLDKLVVGQNIFTTEDEEETPMDVQRVALESARLQVEQCKRMRNTRDAAKLVEAIKRLKDDAAAGKNTIRAMVEATKVHASTAEVIGTVREVYGYHYDPMEIIDSPFNL